MSTHYPRALVRVSAVVDPAEVRPVDASIVANPPERATSSSTDVPPIVAIPSEATWTPSTDGDSSSCEVTIRWSDLPLDPRITRRMTLELWVGDVGSATYSPYRMAGQDRWLRFVGTVDTPSIRFDTDQALTLRARDYSSLFRATRYAVARRSTGATVTHPALPTDHPVQEVVRRVLDAAEGMVPTGPITDVVLDDDVASVLTYAYSDIVGAHPTYTPRSPDMTVWDVVQDICGRIGLTVRVDRTVVRIGSPSFGGSNTRKLTYGHDVETLELARSLTTPAAKAVRVRALRIRERELVSAISPRGTSASEDVIEYPLPAGSWPSDALQFMADAVYAISGKTPLTGRLGTTAMADVDGEDLLDIEPGVTLQLAVRSGAVGGAALASLSRGEMERFLADRVGISKRDAADVADLWSSTDTDRNRFYVERAVHRWSADNGYDLDLDFFNLVG